MKVLKLHVTDLSLGTKILFVGCDTCTKKHACFFCKKGVKRTGEVVAVWHDFDIPTVEVKVKGSKDLLELTQDDLEDPELIEKVILIN